MNTRFGVLLGLVTLGLLCAIGTVAADNAQVNVTPTDYCSAPAPGFDPLGAFAGIFGLRQGHPYRQGSGCEPHCRHPGQPTGHPPELVGQP